MDEIGAEVKYTYLLCKKDGTCLGWSKAEDKPYCGEPDKLTWHRWDKGLPGDVELVPYKLVDGELVQKK